MFFSVSELSVPVPWGEIRGKIWGPDHGHPVLCVHGWADNCGSFNTLIPLLPKGNYHKASRYLIITFAVWKIKEPVNYPCKSQQIRNAAI